MSTKQVSPFLKAWYKWKTLRLPWRRQVLAGLDLHGNSFWEFYDNRSAEVGRPRRIVKYPRKTHPGDVKVSPAWHQWLRHTRLAPPSLDEQRFDVVRQQRIKALAIEADARWAAKPSLAEAPVADRGRAAEPPGGIPGVPSVDVGEAAEANPVNTSGERSQSWRKLQEDKKARKPGQAGTNDPWKRVRGGPSETWQPKGWDPSANTKR